jgi:transcriptional regulator with GAF, ATPase, and Fis domain
MKNSNIKYVILFAFIILFALYKLLLSFNVLPYFITGQDIIVLLLFVVAIILLLIAFAISSLVRKIPRIEESIALQVNNDAEIIDMPTMEEIGKKNLCKYFVALQNYLKAAQDLKEILNKLLVSSAKISHSGRASILLYKSRGDELRVYRTLGWSENEIRLFARTAMKPGEGIAGRVFLEGKPLVVNKPTVSSDSEQKDKYKTHSFVSFPIYSSSTVIGVLNLTEKEDGLYLPHEIDVITFIINEASIYIFHVIESSGKRFH